MLDPRCELSLAEPAAGAFRLTRRRLALAALLLAVGASRAVFAAETIAYPEEVSRSLIVQNLSVQGDRVAGVIANLSDRPVRDVKLQTAYSWLWTDEHKIGETDPSFVVIQVIPDEIPPRGQTTFGYTYPQAHVRRIDGDFIVDVKIVGYRIVSLAPSPSY